MSKEKDHISKKISAARKQRRHYEWYINEFYRMAIPCRPRVGNRAQKNSQIGYEQSDLFDQTLQNAVADYADDQIDELTPDYKPWAKFKPVAGELSTADEENLKDLLADYQERLYDLIRETDFYENQKEINMDMAGSAAGIAIPFAPASRPVKTKPVLMHSLLFNEGFSHDLDFRADEFVTELGDAKLMFPRANIAAVPKLRSAKDATEITVCQGNYLKRTARSDRWYWFVQFNGHTVIDKPLPVGAPPTIIVGRSRNAPPHAWGPGPADNAMAPARILDELAYRNLIKLGKEADPPYSFEYDGTQKYEQGLEAGQMYPRRVGSKVPEALYEASNDQTLYFDRAHNEMLVKRALYQDKPEQEGKTPPTSSQWFDEKAEGMKRRNKRRRYREYVLPVLQRFTHIFARRGELPPIQIDGKLVRFEIRHPLSKASDLAEVSAGQQLAQTIVGTFGEKGLVIIDAEKTANNWKEKVGDETVVLQSPDQESDLVQRIMTEGRNLIREGT